jgi:hypothetical protein
MKRIKVQFDEPRIKPKAERQLRYRPRPIKRIRPQEPPPALADRYVSYFLATIAECRRVERGCYRRLAEHLADTAPADLRDDCSPERRQTRP